VTQRWARTTARCRETYGVERVRCEHLRGHPGRHCGRYYDESGQVVGTVEWGAHHLAGAVRVEGS